MSRTAGLGDFGRFSEPELLGLTADRARAIQAHLSSRHRVVTTGLRRLATG